MTITARKSKLVSIFVVLGMIVPATAEWNPAVGDWGKDDPTDIRVMTWNIYDNIRSEEGKQEGMNSWTAIATIIAGLKPDVLILQEAGDNGCYNCVDSVSDLTTTIELLIHGGTDPFIAGNPQVTAYVQLYDPSYDLPYIFVSGEDDNYNRNVVLSRFPFADLNGDNRSTKNDIPIVWADAYAPGGDGGIRGFMFAEMDLPDEVYLGDLVVGNAHLKAGGDSGDISQRLTASKNVAYVIDYWFNGAGTGMPDPNGKIYDSPMAQTILDENTPVIIGGDWNEDEYDNGRKGPAEWMTRAQYTGGTDGTDRDRSDMLFDDARGFFSGDRDTYGGYTKLDYIAWQDSIATMQHSFVFNSSGFSSSLLPPEVQEFPERPWNAASLASDHRAVIVDFSVPLRGPMGDGDEDGDGDVDLYDVSAFQVCFEQTITAECSFADMDGDGNVTLDDYSLFQDAIVGP